MDKNDQNFLYYIIISVTRALTCQFARVTTTRSLRFSRNLEKSSFIILNRILQRRFHRFKAIRYDDDTSRNVKIIIEKEDVS